jgi:hypothetical protein
VCFECLWLPQISLAKYYLVACFLPSWRKVSYACVGCSFLGSVEYKEPDHLREKNCEIPCCDYLLHVFISPFLGRSVHCTEAEEIREGRRSADA